MNIIAIIPARMGSSRFPGKPLADIHGIPMVGHVTIRTAMCKELSSTWIATCDQVVMDYAASAGLKAVMTADTHVRCTTRTAEAMLKIEEMTGQRADIVVMVQGDRRRRRTHAQGSVHQRREPHGRPRHRERI